MHYSCTNEFDRWNWHFTIETAIQYICVRILSTPSCQSPTTEKHTHIKSATTSWEMYNISKWNFANKNCLRLVLANTNTSNRTTNINIAKNIQIHKIPTSNGLWPLAVLDINRRTWSNNWGSSFHGLNICLSELVCGLVCLLGGGK